MAKFEKVSRFSEIDIALPVRKTANSAGYDFSVAEDITIPSFIASHIDVLARERPDYPIDLEAVAKITKKTGAKPTLVPTGIKCKLDPDTYLELSVRSSSPLKYWLILANGVGIIDADYYNNPDNEGEIYFQIINFSPYSITLHKGDTIGQGIIKHYLLTEDDAASGERVGGFGSTDEQ